MYCSACGTSISTGLNYCNKCGARVEKNAGGGEGHSLVLQYLAMATGFVGLGGLGLTVALIAILLKRDVPPPFLFLLPALFLVLIFAVCYLLIQQISKVIAATTLSNNSFTDRTSPLPGQLGAPNTAQLDEARTPVASVTDTTTRTLDEVFVKRS